MITNAMEDDKEILMYYSMMQNKIDIDSYLV